MMDIDRKDWQTLLRLSLIAFPIFIVGMLLLKIGLGFFFILLSVCVLAFGIAGVLSAPFSDLIFPVTRSKRVPPAYSVPQARVKEGRYEEAIALYEDITEDYPNEVKSYIEMISICFDRLKDPDRAERIYRKGRGGLKEESDLNYLENMYQALKNNR